MPIALVALPASAVRAAMQAGVLTRATDAKEAIPVIVVHMSDRFDKGAGALMSLTLVAAAFGSGPAVLRAMTIAALSFGAGSAFRCLLRWKAALSRAAVKRSSKR